jgi:hypothetical protein
MFRTAKRWALAVALTGLMQLTFVCDSDDLEDFFDDVGIEVYYEDDCGCGDCWYDDCDDWFCDFGCWW